MWEVNGSCIGWDTGHPFSRFFIASFLVPWHKCWSSKWSHDCCRPSRFWFIQ